ncbi:MAG: sialidase family protein [Bacillota bacterium]|nr:sialidase family protein [Bacillota bacterium]
MKGYNKWSFAPYKPFLFNTGDIYICRLAPDENSFHFEWLSIGDVEYKIYLRIRNEGEFKIVGTTKNTYFDVTDLMEESDYEFYVASGDKKSRIRLVRTGEPVGVVVNYLHPDDDVYSFSGNYLCSPSLVRHPDGYLLASMDLFTGGLPQNLTLIFRSDDNGKSWHYVSELFPCYWGKLFIHKGLLYMLSVSTEYGDLLIGCSHDGGKTFDTPTVLFRGSCSNRKAGVHKNPENIVHYNGRIYETLEWGAWSVGYHAPMIMSCSEDDDLMVAENWHFSEPVKYNPDWPGTATGPSSGNIEGTLVVFPGGDLYNVMRYDMSQTVPPYGLVLAYKVNTEDPDAQLEYSHSIKFPGNHSKFMIKKDEKTGKYYSIVTRISAPQHAHHRNLLSLMSSDDMENWIVVCDLFDRRDEDPQYTGFQYVDFEIEGDDIIYLCRTAINKPHSFHDSNYSTFHRIENFRAL